jgi:GNAT superfamily N-acetyltransferase
MSLVIAREPAAQIRADPALPRILLEYAEENGPRRYPHDPDWPAVEALEARGAFVAFTARDHGALIGLVGWRLLPLLDCRVTEAHAAYFYVAPDWRKRGAPKALLAASETHMRARGVKRTVLHDGADRREKRDMRVFGHRPYMRLWVKDLD